MDIKLIKANTGADPVFTNERIIDFLHEHLEQYRDDKVSIGRCLDYVFDAARGGFILVSSENNEITGAVVINYTGMAGYIPENILVYIAVHKNHRGKKIGKQLMEHAIQLTHGSIALHVEANNPARFLYEKLGFTNPYLEMRLKK